MQNNSLQKHTTMFAFMNRPIVDTYPLSTNIYDDIDAEYHKRISDFKKQLHEINREYDEKVKERRKKVFGHLSKSLHCIDSDNIEQSSDNVRYYNKTSITTLDKDGKLHTKVTENNNGKSTSYEETTELVNDNKKRKHVRWLL